MKRIIATFWPQVVIGNGDRDAGPPIDFDVTDKIVAMGKDAALKIRDNREESDELVPDDIREAHLRAYGESASYWVSVAYEIKYYYAETEDD